MNLPHTKDRPAADKTQADLYLLAGTGIYCAGTLVGTVMAGHGEFGMSSLGIAALLACAGPVIWLGVIASASRRFSAPVLALASIAIWCVSLWSLWAVLQGSANL